MIQCWRLDDGVQTLVLGSDAGRLAQVVYWGPPLPQDEDLSVVVQSHAIDVTGGMLDANPDLSLCPEAGRSFPGQAGMILRDAQGAPLLPLFQFARAEVGRTHLR